MRRREETLAAMFAQIKRLEAVTSENHATERKQLSAWVTGRIH